MIKGGIEREIVYRVRCRCGQHDIVTPTKGLPMNAKGAAEMACLLGWERVKDRGWTCPVCLKRGS